MLCSFTEGNQKLQISLPLRRAKSTQPQQLVRNLIIIRDQPPYSADPRATIE